jgi:hypothetical protein
MFSYECIPPNSQGASDAGDDLLSYLATTISCSGRLFIPNVRTQSKKTYSDLRLYLGDVTGRAECLTHHSFRLAFVLVATQSH